MRIEPLFGGTDWITEAQKAALSVALPILGTGKEVVFSEDDTGDGVLHAIINTETLYGDSVDYRVHLNPAGEMVRLDIDTTGDLDDFDWEECESDAYAYRRLMAAGMKEAEL